MKSTCRVVISGPLQWTVLRPALFNVFSKDLRKKNEHTLTRFADDAKLRETADTVEGRTATQEVLECPEEWANRNLMNFNKGKCKVLHMGRKNPLQGHRLVDWGSAQKDLGVMSDSKLNMSQWSVWEQSSLKASQTVLTDIQLGD